MARVQNVDLTTNTQYLDLTGSGKLMLRVGDNDVRLGFDQYSIDNKPYFTLDAGTTYIFDQPYPFVGQNCFVRSDTGTSSLQVLITGGGIE
tara:strand:- start:1332 stop:1604 length:273 start_codon:yes stop_codon:yes gene_type:complete